MMKPRRNRQRGAAMAEMVLLAPVMILMWVGIDYFRSGYARRLQAIADSHQKAWQLAYSNDGSCFSSKEPWAGFTGENDATNPSNTGEKGAEAATTFGGKTSSSLFLYAHANVQTSWKTRAAHFDGDSVGSMNAGTYVACNEVVPATNAESGKGSNGYDQFADQNVLTPLWDFVRSLF
jgi:hypothetical protein